jgi:F-type H+-transporting ATPase subunit gamma
MEQLENLRRKLESARDLLGVVKTMKALAAVNIREYERAVESLADYGRSIELGFQVLMRDRAGEAHRPVGEPRSTGAVVIGSELGMVGQFNDHIASFALEKLEDLGIPVEERTLMALGRKLIDRLRDKGQPVRDRIPVFGSMVDVTSVIQEVIFRIEDWREEGKADRILIFHNRPASGTAYDPHMSRLFPLDLDWLRGLARRSWPSRTIPTYSMGWDPLFAALTRQYFFLSLYRSAMESLNSENASRLASMQAAEKNIEDRLEELEARFQHQRQEAITSELMDIVSGYEVISSEN